MRNYYHAGTEISGTVSWSEHTRLTREAAETEARHLAAKRGGRPIVEWWPRSAGLRPGDCESVIGADYVD